MITGDLRNKIDRLWLEFWRGGIANPLTIIEQITFLMFSRLLDINETRDQKSDAHRQALPRPHSARCRTMPDIVDAPMPLLRISTRVKLIAPTSILVRQGSVAS